MLRWKWRRSGDWEGRKEFGCEGTVRLLGMQKVSRVVSSCVSNALWGSPSPTHGFLFLHSNVNTD